MSAAPLCPDTDIWKLCRFLGNMLRALSRLPGGLGRFIPGRIGANRGRLRHVGWEKCCHGPTCRSQESAGEAFLCDLLSLLVYPHASGGALLDGTLNLTYHTLPFARRKPTWRLPTPGQVPRVVADFHGGVAPLGVHHASGSVSRGFVRQCFKRVRLTKKTRCPMVYRVSAQPIPHTAFHDPLGEEAGGNGRRGCQEGCMRCPSQEAGWIRKELVDSTYGG